MKTKKIHYRIFFVIIENYIKFYIAKLMQDLVEFEYRFSNIYFTWFAINLYYANQSNGKLNWVVLYHVIDFGFNIALVKPNKDEKFPEGEIFLAINKIK